MESKKINQLATNVSPQTSDLTIIGDPTTGVSKKITLLQIANLFATTGTVSSVGVTETGDALTITGSPITTAGTINIGFAGAATQYVRGDGALADFPTSTGGGSSVSYYLNSSVSQGTIGGVAYRQLSKTPIAGAGTDITISANGYVASYITDSNDPALLEVPAGNFNCEFYFSVNSNAHNPNVYAELYKYDGTTFTLLGSSQSIPEYLKNGSTLSAYYFAMPIAVASLTITDRLAIRIYVNVDTKIVTLHTENSHLCQVVTTFSKGLTTLNSLTRQTQYFATGTSGTDFAISSSLATHTFNLPDASATNRGLITTGTQTIAGDKSFTGINSFDYGINYKTGASLANVSGYISQAYATSGTGAGSTLSLKISDGNSVKAINLDFVGSPATYTYTFPAATGTIALTSDLSSYVPYSGATGSVDLGSNSLSLKTLTANGNAGSSGSLHLKQNDTINVGGVNYGTIATNTLQQFVFYWENSSFAKRFNLDFSALSALGTAITFSLPNTSGTIALTSDLTSGTVTSVAALTLGTTGTDLSSTVANGTTTPVITLNVPTASATNRGALSSTDWSTFNSKQSALTNPVTGTGTSGQVTYFNGTSTVVGSSNHFWDATNNRLGIGISTPAQILDIFGSSNTGVVIKIKNNTDGEDNVKYAGIDFVAGSDNGTSAIRSYRTNSGSNYETALAFLTNPSGSTQTPTEKMRITSGGKAELLVGTSSASGWSSANRGLLELNGGSSGSALLGLKINDVQRAYFYHNNSNLYIENMLAGASVYVISISGGVYLAANATSWTSNSDERLKNINSNIDNALSKLMTLRAVNFSWKTDDSNKENFGLIAQDVEKVFPQVIDKNKLPSKPEQEQTDETEYLGVRYQELIPVLVKAIQEMNTKLNEQNQTIQNLQEQINILAK